MAWAALRCWLDRGSGVCQRWTSAEPSVACLVNKIDLSPVFDEPKSS